MLGYAENTLPLGFLTQCEPQSLSGTLTGTESSSQWRRYDKMRRFPDPWRRALDLTRFPAGLA